MSELLLTWAGVVVEERGTTEPRPPRAPLARLAAVVRWWDSQVDWLMSTPYAVDFQAEVIEAHRRLQRAAGMGRDVRYVVGGCPHCGRAGTLTRYGPRHAPRQAADGTVIADPVLIVCNRGDGACGLVMTEEEHDRWRIHVEQKSKADAA